MTDDGYDSPLLWYRASAKNRVIFLAIWAGNGVLSLTFVKWVVHGTAAVYWLLVPWTLFGLIMVAVRPSWILSVKHRTDEMLEQAAESFEKRPPPGFP